MWLHTAYSGLAVRKDSFETRKAPALLNASNRAGGFAPCVGLREARCQVDDAWSTGMTPRSTVAISKLLELQGKAPADHF